MKKSVRRSTAERVRAATEGESFSRPPVRVMVARGCGTQEGFWVCLTHPDDRPMSQYRNQLQKDIHIGDDREHVLGWFCSEHGRIEVP